MDSLSTPQYNATVEGLIETEFPMLRDSIYLDHAGTTPYPVSLLQEFSKDMASNLYGNPHSASASSQLSTTRIEDVRLRALQFLGADPAHFDLVFTANATAAIKLVSDAFRALPGGFNYLYHQAAHTSLVGVREEAQSSHCLDDQSVEALLLAPDQAAPCDTSRQESPTLFAYSAQSNFDGSRSPLSWAEGVRKVYSESGGSTAFTLLDAASLVASSALDLSDSKTAPDFVVLSFYKIFGFPDLGALLVRRQAQAVLDSRRYFGGGTVDMVVSIKEQWHAPKTDFLHERLEDGTLPVHSIVALDVAMTVHRRLFGPMSAVASHTAFLARRLQDGLEALRHGSGLPVCALYSPRPEMIPDGGPASSGPIVAFNIRNASGAWLSLAEFEKLATLKNIHVRTGGVCNPGGVAAALGLEPWEMKKNLSAGFRCGTESDVTAGKPTGVIRASLGAMSTLSDVEGLVDFITEFFQDMSVPSPPSEVTLSQISPSAVKSAPHLCVRSLAVYPIKSCGAYPIPDGMEWGVRPEGLAWDREWCLLHQGSGQALSQKRYPKMALVRPVVDFGCGELRVRYHGELPPGVPDEVTVPLSHNPALFQRPNPHGAATPSRVCGERVVAQSYAHESINSFFSSALGVPCVLARFPPGGSQDGGGRRYAKARIQKHEAAYQNAPKIPRGSLHPELNLSSPPSPPDSDLEISQRPILLSNESPILAINLASVRALNGEIKVRGGIGVPASSFRANVAVGDALGGDSDDSGRCLPYSEDGWQKLRIGRHSFTILGACRRCQMVCIDQETGRRREEPEPFATLSKTRRSDGKVFFGAHMALAVGSSSGAAVATREAQYPTIMVGDRIFVDDGQEG